MPPLNRGESKIQAEILRYLNGLPRSYFFKTVVCNRSGVPDIVGVYKGHAIYIEVKSSRGKLSELQFLAREKLLEASAIHIVARELDTVKAVIRELQPIDSVKEDNEN